MKTKKRFLSILLSLALVLGLMPGMSLTAYAATNTYTELIPKDSDTDLSAKQVTFNGYKWYIIADNSTAMNAGSVTLLAAESMKTSAFRNVSGSTAYIGSTVKDYLDGLTTGEGSFAAVADAIRPVTLTTYKYQSTTEVAETIENAKLYLLSIGEARALPVNVRKCSAKYWWLRSPGHPGYPNDPSFLVATVEGNTSNAGYVYESGEIVTVPCEIRPALQLDMSKVVFDSTTNTFSLLVSYPLWVGDTQVTSANASNIDGNNKASYNADTSTLTLDGYSYSGKGHGDRDNIGVYSPIYAKQDLTIEVSGTNDVKNTSKTYGSAKCYAVFVTGDLNITGNGTLNAQEGVNCQNNITINGGTVNAVVTGEAGSGIDAGKRVTINGGTVTATGVASGINASSGEVKITGGTVTTTGKNGIQTDNGDIIISGGTVKAIGNDGYGIKATSSGSSGYVEIKGDSVAVTASGTESGINASKGVKNAIDGTGWTNTAGDEGEAEITVGDSQDLTAYKKVQFPGVKKYTITFDANGGTGTMQPQIIAGSGELTPNTFTRSSQIFTLWNTKADGTGKNYYDGGWIGDLTSDITLYAQWIEPNVKVGAVFKAGDTMKFAAKTMYVKPSDKIWDTHGSYTIKVNEIHDDYASMSTLYYDGASNLNVGFTPAVTGANCIKVISGSGAETDPYILELGVAKDAATVTTAPTAKTLTYTGSAQELVTAGTADGGTMQYALGTDDKTAPTSGWSESIPTGTDAGTYYVWYKAVGDDNHLDSEAAYVAATIEGTPSVTLSSNTLTLAVDEEKRLTATVVPEGSTVTWTSSDESKVTVDSTGKVKGLLTGTATIKATITVKEQVYSAECEVTVSATPQPVVTPSVTLSETSLTLAVNEEKTLTATVVPQGSTVIWTSSDESKVTVDSTGKVKGLLAGTATVKATITENGQEYSAECAVTVSAAPEPVITPSVTLSATTLSLTANEEQTLSATVVPVETTVTWTSSDTAKVSVDSTGKVKGIAAGTAKITATITVDGQEYKAECDVTVTEESGPSHNIVVPETLSDDNISQEIIERYGSAAQVTLTLEEVMGVTPESRATSRTYDAQVWVETAEGRRPATREDITSDGLQAVFPYPEGTNKDDHIFSGAHMFGETAGGFQAGDIEGLTFRNEDDGLHTIIHGLSPVIITWTRRDTPAAQEEVIDRHVHVYGWDTIEATADQDGEMRYQCRICGDIQTRVPITAYYIFNKETTEKIRQAKQGQTVKIETARWISFHKMVLEALAERPDVTLEVSFLDEGHKGTRKTFTIPAGTADLTSLADDKGFAGFIYLTGKFGNTAIGN